MTKIALPQTQRPFEAVRDRNGVAHVIAQSRLDAIFGLGYLHAMDRGTQMLFSRSVASGRGVEEIADTPELRETDAFFRRVKLERNLIREVVSLSSSLREQLAAYCDGVNDSLSNVGRSLPMWATGYQPRPWNEESILLIGKLLSFGGLAVSQMQNERLLIELIHAGVDEQALRELFSPRLDNVDFALLRQIKMANQLSSDALELITDLPRLAGSNAWAVRPERSATGAALLASDPHLEVNRLPAIWYEAAIRWNDDYVMGATLPGCPLFAVARTQDLAWGVTYMKGDTVDYFVENCRAGGATGWQYRRDDEWVDFEVREEVLESKSGEAKRLRFYENKVGTLESDPDQLGPGYHLSLAWSGNLEGSGSAIAAWLDVTAAKTTQEGMRTVRTCEQPTLCWVFADRNGDIGLQSCGRFPKRHEKFNGLTPIPAWDTGYHWKGWVEQELLPRVFNPPEGFVATANEEMNLPNRPAFVTQPLPGYRKRRIDQRLSELPQATVQDMQDLQYDLVSLQAQEMLAVFLPHLPDGDLRDRLEQWDCRYTPDSCEATLFQRLYVNVIYEVLGHDQGIGWSRMVYLCTRMGYSMMVLRAADRILCQDDSVWWRGRDKGELVRRAASRAVGEPDQPWSDVNYFHFADRFFGNHQVGRMFGFKSRRYPMPGNHATPFQGHVLQTATRETTFAPSYHFVTDLSVDEAWTNLPGGPNESRFSRYYKIDIQRWLSGEYKQLLP
jgi:penicillin amidase